MRYTSTVRYYFRMDNFSLRQRSLVDLAERVLVFKKTIKQWFYYAGLKYMQQHKLNDVQENLLEDITDFYVEYMDNIENDKEFFKKIKIDPVGFSVK